jgi:hypothetical protein
MVPFLAVTVAQKFKDEVIFLNVTSSHFRYFVSKEKYWKTFSIVRGRAGI